MLTTRYPGSYAVRWRQSATLVLTRSPALTKPLQPASGRFVPPSPYPRDLHGYGAQPPQPRWPGEARTTVQFVMNCEEGGEACNLHGDAASEAFLSEIVEEGGFLYQSDSYAEGLPYRDRAQLVIPYTLDANDMRFASPAGFASGEDFFTYLRDSFDLLYRQGESAPKLLSVGLHCRLAGRPGGAAALSRFLDPVLAHDRVWVARRLDVARHWHANHPPQAGIVAKDTELQPNYTIR